MAEKLTIRELSANEYPDTQLRYAVMALIASVKDYLTAQVGSW